MEYTLEHHAHYNIGFSYNNNLKEIVRATVVACWLFKNLCQYQIAKCSDLT